MQRAIYYDIAENSALYGALPARPLPYLFCKVGQCEKVRLQNGLTCSCPTCPTFFLKMEGKVKNAIFLGRARIVLGGQHKEKGRAEGQVGQRQPAENYDLQKNAGQGWRPL